MRRHPGAGRYLDADAAASGVAVVGGDTAVVAEWAKGVVLGVDLSTGGSGVTSTSAPRTYVAGLSQPVGLLTVGDALYVGDRAVAPCTASPAAERASVGDLERGPARVDHGPGRAPRAPCRARRRTRARAPPAAGRGRGAARRARRARAVAPSRGRDRAEGPTAHLEGSEPRSSTHRSMPDSRPARAAECCGGGQAVGEAPDSAAAATPSPRSTRKANDSRAATTAGASPRTGTTRGRYPRTARKPRRPRRRRRRAAPVASSSQRRTPRVPGGSPRSSRWGSSTTRTTPYRWRRPRSRGATGAGRVRGRDDVQLEAHGDVVDGIVVPIGRGPPCGAIEDRGIPDSSVGETDRPTSPEDVHPGRCPRPAWRDTTPCRCRCRRWGRR